MAMRTVLVTGGSNGIGRAAVERFVRGGDRVWFTYRLGRQRARELVDALGDAVQAFELDQGDWESHQRLLAALPGPVDVLVNNAAVGSKTVERYVEHTGAESEPARDLAFFTINCVGPLWLTRHLLPGMLERGYGKIVNVSSVGGGVTQLPDFHLADGMTKAALAHLTRQLAAELARTPVDVYAVCPGAVETDMFEASTLGHLSPEARRELVATLPKGRLIEPEEVAELVWWLSTDAARLLHGAVVDASMGLGVNPGMLIKERRHD
jgi:NAD(P)-dependent dehydrogenase (short-subunit alcohol dehydrogenase family)